MKLKILLSALCFLPFISNSQNFYGGFSGGYALPFSNQLVWSSVDPSGFENVAYARFGKGTSLEVYGGYKINERLSLEIAARYFCSAKFHYSNMFSYASYPLSGLNELHIRSFGVTPTIRVEFGHANPRFYLKEGFTIGFGNKYIQNNPVKAGIEYQFTKRGGISYGFISAIGVTARLAEHIAVFAELNCIYMTWAPTEGEYTKGSVYGEDVLSYMTVREREEVYLDQLPAYTGGPQTIQPDQPRQYSKTFYSLSGAGLSIGMHFNF
jgi:hypothetical protein